MPLIILATQLENFREYDFSLEIYGGIKFCSTNLWGCEIIFDSYVGVSFFG